jgi:glyoxylase-like metal-dependent hydrolase (beta-lactamase superfamily II)
VKVELLNGIHLVTAGRINFGHPLNCNVYLVRGKERNVLIDAGCGFGVDTMVASLDGYGFHPRDIELILLTHCHWDHARGCKPLLDRGVHDVAIHSRGVEAVTVGPKWYEFGFDPAPQITFEPLASVQTFDDGTVIDLGGRSLRVVWTPGHTTDSVCFLLEENGRRYAFTGDTVSVLGRPGVMTADTDFVAYRDSLRKLDSLHLDGMFPGHGLWMEEGAHEHVAVLAERLNGKFSDLAPHPRPMESGNWVLRNHPEAAR